MVKGYLFTAWRNCLARPVPSAINVLGLSIGLACCLLVLLYCRYESTYDSHFPNSGQIYNAQILRAYPTGEKVLMSSVGAKSAERVSSLPGVKGSTYFSQTKSQVLFEERQINYMEQTVYASPDYFKLFPMQLIHGDLEQALEGPGKAVITEKTAYKLFGTVDALGKSFAIAVGSKTQHLTVTGVIENPPPNSNFQGHIVTAFHDSVFSSFMQRRPMAVTLYLQLFENTNVADFEQQGSAVLADDVVLGDEIRLLPLRAVNTEKPIYGSASSEGYTTIFNYQLLYGLMLLAGLILLVAICNFINLVTAHATQRTREIAIRKVSGARPGQLFTQFILESTVHTALATLLAIGLVAVALPWLRGLVDLHFSYHSIYDPSVLLAVFALVTTTALAAGSYPAWRLARLSPVRALRGESGKHSRARLRKLLLMGQFAVASGFIIFTLFASQQVALLKHRDFGYNHHQLYRLGIGGQIVDARTVLKQKLLEHSNITAVGAHGVIFAGMAGAPREARLTGSDHPFAVIDQLIEGDADLLETLQVPLLNGRSFDPARQSDFTELSHFGRPGKSAGGLIATPRLLQVLGLSNAEQAIEKTVEIQLHLSPAHGSEDLNKQQRASLQTVEIIGVSSDVDLGTHQYTLPVAGFILVTPEAMRLPQFSVRMASTLDGDTMAYLKSIWRELGISTPVEGAITNIAAGLDIEYQKTANLLRLIGLMAIIAILLSCLGLYAMAAFAVQRRTREIGMRKVLGASAQQIIRLLLADFSKPVVLGLLIAAAPAWLVADRLLQHFAVQIDLSVWIVLLAGCVTAFIGLITVSGYTYRATAIDPAHSLKVD